MKICQKLYPFLALAVLSGCAQYQWQKQGATQAEFNSDSYACELDAAHAYPTAMVRQQTHPGYTSPAITNCTSNGSAYGSGNMVYGNGSTNCYTTPGQTVAPTYINVDQNEGNRTAIYKSCLVARGYSLVRVK
jgi:hypothetical protein